VEDRRHMPGDATKPVDPLTLADDDRRVRNVANFVDPDVGIGVEPNIGIGTVLSMAPAIPSGA
jgi:hypothetical protein